MRITNFHKPTLLAIGLASLGLLLFAPRPAAAANPTTMNFQGKIVNAADGTNIATPTGTYSIVFRIYNTSSPTMTTSCTSTASCLWQETQASVQLTNGIFQVELGSSCALTSSSCNNTAGGPISFASSSSLYLTMQFNGDTSGSNGGFMSPLIHVTSVPFAFQADNAASLGGIAAANYVQLAQGLQTDSSTTNASIAINKTNASGTPNILTLQKSGKNTLVVDNSGAVILGQVGASGLDGKLVFNNATGSNTATIVLTGNPTTSYTYQLPTGTVSSNQCLQSGTVSGANVPLTFSSCGAGGGTFATTYSTTSQASNTVTYSNSGGGALILQNASTPLTTLFTIENNAATFNYLTVTLASSIPHLQVFGASSTAYADIYYDAGATTAHFSASSGGTTQVGTGSGPVNITAGASSAVAITGHANSTFTTDSGYVRLDGPSGVQLGIPSSSSGNLVFNYGSGAATAAITFAGNSTANYVYTLPSTAVSSSQCLQSGTVSGTAVPLTFGSCGAGGGDNITVNSATTTDANFLDVAATGTVAGTTWTLNTATNPDNITLAISTATASAAGVVSNTTQTLAGAKTFQSNATGGFIVQDSANSKNILSVDTSGDQVVLGVAGTSGAAGRIVFNTTNASSTSVTLVSQSTATSYSIVLPSATSGGTNYCLVGTNASGTTTTSWLPCGSGSTGKITLSPEYPGAVMTADGSGNTGTMTSDFCSGSSLRNIPSTLNPCAASEEHNFYTWVTTSQNDYDIWIRWQVPSDFSDFAASNAIQMYGWRTDSTATTSVTLNLYNSSGTLCGTATNVATGTATWTQTSLGGTVTAAGCSISAGNVVDFRVQMAANNKTVRAGEITINYQRN
jgi:hypothetical protein